MQQKLLFLLRNWEIKNEFDKNILSFMERSTKALETLSKSKSKKNILITKADGYLWNADELQLIPVDNINAINLELLKGY